MATATGLLGSTTKPPADYSSQIKDFYKTYLGRDAEQAGVDHYQQMAGRGQTLEQIQAEIAGSTEARQRQNSAIAQSTSAKATAVGYTPTDVKVTPESTSAGQLAAITANGSPLITQAETQAKKDAASRGLLNSSIAAGAGREAVYKTAMPLAQQDANTNAAAENTNATQKTTAAQFLAGAQNNTSQFNAGQQNAMQQTLTQADLQRELQKIQSNTSLTVAEKQIASQQLIAQNQNNSQMTIAERENAVKLQLQKIQADTSLTVAEKEIASRQLIAQSQNNSQQTIADKQINSQQTIAERENAVKLQLQQIDAETKKSLAQLDEGTKIKLQSLDSKDKLMLQTNISAANAYAQLAQALSSISTSTTMDASAKQQASDNQINLFRQNLQAIGQVSGLDLSKYFQQVTAPAANTPAADTAADTSGRPGMNGSLTEFG